MADKFTDKYPGIITLSSQCSKDEITAVLQHHSGALEQALLRTFFALAETTTIWLTPPLTLRTQEVLLARAKAEPLLTLALSEFRTNCLRLSVFLGRIELVGNETVFEPREGIIATTGPVSTGEWSATKGNQLQKQLRVSFTCSELTVPSIESNWLFSAFLPLLNTFGSEHCTDPKNGEVSYDGLVG